MKSSMTLAALAAALCACGNSPEGPREVVARSSLSAMLGSAASSATGVAIDPLRGRRFVLAGRTLYELSGDEVVSRLDMDAAAPDLTDVAAVGDGRLALTGPGEGYLFDPDTRELVRYFCFLPDEPPPGNQPEPRPGPVVEPGFVQRSEAVAVDASIGRIYAQPRSMPRDAAGPPTHAQIATFSIDGGLAIRWDDLPNPGFTAGGMAIGEGGDLVLGSGSALHRFDVRNATLEPWIDLADLGIGDIQGLAYDADGETLVVLDRDGDELVEIR